jgi:hypothetical protein
MMIAVIVVLIVVLIVVPKHRAAGRHPLRGTLRVIIIGCAGHSLWTWGRGLDKRRRILQDGVAEAWGRRRQMGDNRKRRDHKTGHHFPRTETTGTLATEKLKVSNKINVAWRKNVHQEKKGHPEEDVTRSPPGGATTSSATTECDRVGGTSSTRLRTDGSARSSSSEKKRAASAMLH